MNDKDTLADLLIEAGEALKYDRCGLTQEQINDLTSMLNHVRLNKSQAAEFVGLSTRQFDRYVAAGKLPPGKHELGSKSLYWYKDELMEADCK